MRATEKKRAERKCEIAIDKMVDLQDMGLGGCKVQRILDLLNELKGDLDQ